MARQRYASRGLDRLSLQCTSFVEINYAAELKPFVGFFDRFLVLAGIAAAKKGPPNGRCAEKLRKKSYII